VETHVGPGTSIHIYLPESRSSKTDTIQTSIEEMPQRGDEKVLIVEDESKVRKMAMDVLSGYGYTVLSAGSGEEALNTARGKGGRRSTANGSSDAGHQRARAEHPGLGSVSQI